MTDTPNDNPRPDRSPDRAAMIVAAKAASAEQGVPSGRSSGLTTYRWSRWIHVYTSMLAFLVILFFGITGVTLNHPSWTFGDATNTSTETGTMGVDVFNADGSVNYLGMSEYIRSNYSIGGHVSAFGSTSNEAEISYRNPGYSADLIVNTTTGEFTLTTVQQGWLAVLNDLHKGRDSGSGWSWVIDLSGIFLVVVSLTGIVMQFYLRKRRTAAYITAVLGAALLFILIWITLH